MRLLAPIRRRMATRWRRLGRFLVAILATVAVVAVGLTVTRESQAAGNFNYAEALQKAVWFYDAQRLGDLPATNRVSWRADSFLSDGQDVNMNLTGGFADAGDTIKATFPLSHSLTTLAWSIVDNPQGYTTAGQSANLLSNLRWGMDYLIRAHPAANRLVAEIGDPNEDHKIWAAAELQTYSRKTYFIDSTCGGSEVAASTAAAFASSSMAFRSSDATYAATLLTHARQLYTFADTVRRNYIDCVPIMSGFYNNWSGYFDELVWGALWLYQATGETAYLDKARSLYSSLPKSGQNATDPTKYAWTYDWDDKTVASVVMLAKLTGDAQYITDANRWADWIAGPGVNGQKATYSPGGEVFIGQWGSLRYAASSAMLALYYADSGRFDATRSQRLHDFAVRQIDYILGLNPSSTSYMVGFGSKYIQMPHHRTAHGPWGNSPDKNPVETRHVLYGALIGGPTAADDNYGPEQRNNFQKAEVALDYNAGMTGALARLTKEFGGTPLASIPTETPDGPEMYVLASLNQQGVENGQSFFEIKALLQNKSAWPARPLTNGSFRYYFTLDAGQSPSGITVTSPYHQCASPGAPTLFSGNVYYVTIDCTGVRIAPTGEPDFTKENQFRIKFPGTHDYTKDWSFSGVSPTQGTPTLASHITVFDGATKVFGDPPGPVTTTPPGPPGQPRTTTITQTSATLTWPASTAGTNPIAGYDVYRVGTPDTLVASSTTTTATVTGLSGGITYTFYVRARDTTGLQSTNSPTVNVTTIVSDPVPPGAPGQPTASNVGTTSLTLTWTAATAGTNPIAAYDVYRVASPDAIVATSTTLSANVTGLTPGTQYTFYVRARDTIGVTGPASLTRTVTTGNVTPTPTPTGVGCRVVWAVANDWGSGFTANVTITNTGSTAINGWALRFTFPGNQQITNLWGGVAAQQGQNVTVTNADWNANLPPGASAQPGFNANYSGTNARPTAFTVNGVTCTTN